MLIRARDLEPFAVAFVCTVQLDEVRADFFHKGADTLVNLHIGYDDEKSLNYNLLLGLAPSPLGPEYFFCLLEIDGYNNTEREIWDAREVRRFISKQDKLKVRRLLLESTAQLLNMFPIDCFCMATRDADLLDTALEKYRALCHVFSQAGYKVTESDSYHGRLMWWAERGG